MPNAPEARPSIWRQWHESTGPMACHLYNTLALLSAGKKSKIFQKKAVSRFLRRIWYW